MMKCVICETTLTKFLYDWLFICPCCKLEVSRLDEPGYNGTELIGWDESSEKFLESLRLENSRKILSALDKLIPVKNKCLLDVGCAAGWFLETAEKSGMQVKGIEPDEKIAMTAEANGFDIIKGYFPDCLSTPEKFDCISFNDVFEHLKDPHAVLEECRKYLNDSGILILNLPSSGGFFYRMSRLCANLGLPGNLNRLWQKGYESPHLYYYNDNNLSRLLQSHSFRLIYRDTLPSIDLSGLWGRINEGDHTPAKMVIVYAAILTAFPLIRYVFPDDIMFHIYQKYD